MRCILGSGVLVRRRGGHSRGRALPASSSGCRSRKLLNRFSILAATLSSATRERRLTSTEDRGTSIRTLECAAKATRPARVPLLLMLFRLSSHHTPLRKSTQSHLPRHPLVYAARDVPSRGEKRENHEKETQNERGALCGRRHADPRSRHPGSTAHAWRSPHMRRGFRSSCFAVGSLSKKENMGRQVAHVIRRKKAR